MFFENIENPSFDHFLSSTYDLYIIITLCLKTEKIKQKDQRVRKIDVKLNKENIDVCYQLIKIINIFVKEFKR